LADRLGVVAGEGDEGLTCGVVVGEAGGDDLAVGLDEDRLDGFVAVEGGGQDSAAAEAGVQGPVRVDRARPKGLVLRKCAPPTMACPLA
jgi:hypothetical protein